MLPLSDYGRDGAPITFKAWVCHNPDCGFNIRIDNGEISFGQDDRPELQVSGSLPERSQVPTTRDALVGTLA